MTQELTKITYLAARGEVVALNVTEGHSLRALDAPVWVTRHNDMADYWLAPGEAMYLQPRDRLWLSVEQMDARVELTLLPQAQRFASRRLAAWLGGWRRMPLVVRSSC